jgi:hypothetical protein
MPFYDNLDVIEYLHDKFEDNKTALGLGYVGYADEKLLPRYPAIVLASGQVDREVALSQKFLTVITLEIYVLHAALNASHKARTQQDLLLVRAITDLLHLDMTLDGNIVHGFVAEESPGEIVGEKGAIVVGTRMLWIGQTREPFRRP